MTNTDTNTDTNLFAFMQTKIKRGTMRSGRPAESWTMPNNTYASPQCLLCYLLSAHIAPKRSELQKKLTELQKAQNSKKSSQSFQKKVKELQKAGLGYILHHPFSQSHKLVSNTWLTGPVETVQKLQSEDLNIFEFDIFVFFLQLWATSYTNYLE